MPAQWTGDVERELHIAGISHKEFSVHMGMNPKYVSSIMNGHRSPKNAEQKFRAALEELLRQKSTAPK